MVEGGAERPESLHTRRSDAKINQVCGAVGIGSGAVGRCAVGTGQPSAIATVIIATIIIAVVSINALGTIGPPITVEPAACSPSC